MFTFKSILACTAAVQANTKFRYPRKWRIGASKFRRVPGTMSTLRQAGTKCLTRCLKKDAKAIQVTRWNNNWFCRCYSKEKSRPFSTKPQLQKTQSMVARKIRCEPAGKCTFLSSMLPVYLSTFYCQCSIQYDCFVLFCGIQKHVFGSIQS